MSYNVQCNRMIFISLDCIRHSGCVGSDGKVGNHVMLPAQETSSNKYSHSLFYINDPIYKN